MTSQALRSQVSLITIRLMAALSLNALVMATPTAAQGLLVKCGQEPLPLNLTTIEGEGEIWNVDLDGNRKWNYEGAPFEVPLPDYGYADGSNIALNLAVCSAHFHYYYTDAGTHQVSRTYVEEMATLLEEAWDILSDDQGFRDPLDLKEDLRYTIFTDFNRIPVLIHGVPTGAKYSRWYPFIFLTRNISASSSGPLHELFHTVNYGYTHFGIGRRDSWLREGMARWSQKFKDVSTPCGGYTAYRPLTYSWITRGRDYCDYAPFFQYLGQKYGRGRAGGDGSDVIRAMLEELGAVEANDTRGAMLAIERALDGFDTPRISGYGKAFAEYAVGNYVDDSTASSGLRSGAPLAPRLEEGGEVGRGGHQYALRDYVFQMPARGTITIQVRAAAGDYDGDRDDDDLRVRLDGEPLGEWNSTNSFDGAVLGGRIRTVHIVKRDLLLGQHTLQLEADEHPILYSINVFSGAVPLLHQASPDAKAGDADFPARSEFNVPAGVSDITVHLSGVARDNERLRIELDGVELAGSSVEAGLGGTYLADAMATVQVQKTKTAQGLHSLEFRTTGSPTLSDVAVFPTPISLPLLQVRNPRLDPWAANYHVIQVGHELLPSDEDVLVPRGLTILIGTNDWSHEFAPPFHRILLIDRQGRLQRTLSGDDSHSVSREITPETLRDLGLGGRVVIVVGTEEGHGSYSVRITR